MSGKARPWQKTIKFVDGLKADLPDEQLAAIKRYVERRSREAVQVTVTPVNTARHCIPRSPNPEISSDVYVSMEEKDESRMNPELTELESSSAGTGLETPAHQCLPNEGISETGRTIADGHLLVGMGSNQGGDISSSKERVGTQAGTAICVCVCIFFPFILDIKFVGRTSRGHTGGRSHGISHPPSFCGACLNFSREKDSAIIFPRRP